MERRDRVGFTPFLDNIRGARCLSRLIRHRATFVNLPKIAKNQMMVRLKGSCMEGGEETGGDER